MPEAVGHIELDSGAEIAELKEALAKESYRVESLEKDMKQIRRVVEDTVSSWRWVYRWQQAIRRSSFLVLWLLGMWKQRSGFYKIIAIAI